MRTTTSGQLASLTVDNFLPDWKELREYADRAQYSAVVNPVDDVEYPGICTAVPMGTKAAIENRLARIHGTGDIDLRTVFFRLSLEGVQAPHQAHTDSTMGQYSLMLYMNRAQHCQGGTSLVQHKMYGFDSDKDLSKHGLRVWQRDTNKPDAWSIKSMAHMQPNRAFIFPSHYMHRAEPVGGFGTNQRNGRLVLTAFYNVGDSSENPFRNGG